MGRLPGRAHPAHRSLRERGRPEPCGDHRRLALDFVNDIKRDFDRPDSPVVATEFVGTSISTNGDNIVYGPYYGPMIKFNPHIQFLDGDRRGYVRCVVVVEDGVPGAHQI